MGDVANEGHAERHVLARGALRRRSVMVAAGMLVAFSAVGVQLIRLAAKGQPAISSNISAPVAKSYARPDIVDRNGRLLATDVEAPSLFADPALVLDRNEVAEKLRGIFPDLDEVALRNALADKARRFVWIKRGLPPRVAQQVHDLGLPGLAFQRELKRTYPAARLAGHVLGSVNVDNKGLQGIERYIDEVVGLEPVLGATLTERPPVRLSLDIGVQHSLEDELADAMARYGAEGAAGLVMDVRTGEMVASASLPGVDPARPNEGQDPARLDKTAVGSFELGSVFKIMTIAMALDTGLASPETELDVREPLTAGRFTISDLHPAGRPLSVAEVFLHSSNVGAGMLALQAGPVRQREFLQRLGLLDAFRTEAGPLTATRIPERWERAEQITISYGHGIAMSPLQFAAATAALINGGHAVKPSFLLRAAGPQAEGERVIAAATSAKIRDLMRRNVTEPGGTGRRADVQGYRIGGKTGTAEIASAAGYQARGVISSFIAAFPIDAPQYVTFVLLFEPKSGEGRESERTAGTNAAPATGRLIERIAPILGVAPRA